MAQSQSHPMALKTSKGSALLFMSMSAHEEVSRLFEYQIIAVSDDGDLAADDLLGTPVAVALEVEPGTTRWFNGMVASFGIEGAEGRRVSYRITARPWLWLLTRASNVRIFQQQTVPDIVQAVFADYNGSVKLRLSGSYRPRVYCVQYRESDFNFVSRLMEEEGIFYWFEHSEDQHALVLADAPGAHVEAPGFEEVAFRVAQQMTGVLPAIHQWQMRQEIQSGKFRLRDHDFENPGTDLTSESASSSRKHAESTHEVYDYPGLYAEKGAGDDRARIRLEEASARFGRYTGQGSTPGLAVGAKFALTGHPRKDQNAVYLVLATQIELRQAGYASGGQQDSGIVCRFTLQRHDEPFRPARTTPKPAVAGPQTAVVVGQGDAGDIVTDKYGRVKVQFHWDRLGKHDDGSSCWVRVASPWAGNGFGMIALPRLGQEVVVEFLEGDPDQPLITGRVHNAKQLPPYELPANATVSTIKSRSKLGPADAFNELRFEDKKGSEYVWLQAQKDRFEVVEETLKTSIGKDEHRSVKQNRKEFVEGEYHLTVAKAVKQKFDAKLSVEAKEDMLLEAGDGFSLKTGKDIAVESGKGISFKSATDLHIKIGTNIGAEGSQNVHIKAGMNVVIEGGMQISIKAGPSSIVLGPDGVSITGPMVKINSGGSAGSGSGASPVAPTAPEAPDKPELPEDPLAHR